MAKAALELLCHLKSGTTARRAACRHLQWAEKHHQHPESMLLMSIPANEFIKHNENLEGLLGSLKPYWDIPSCTRHVTHDFLLSSLFLSCSGIESISSTHQSSPGPHQSSGGGVTGCQRGPCSSQPHITPISEGMHFSLSSNNSIYIRASGKINPTCKVPSRSAALPACCLPLLWLLPGRRLLLYLPERGESPLPAAELGSRPTGVNWWPRELICQQRYNSRMRCRMTQQNQNEGVGPWGI